MKSISIAGFKISIEDKKVDKITTHYSLPCSASMKARVENLKQVHGKSVNKGLRELTEMFLSQLEQSKIA